MRGAAALYVFVHHYVHVVLSHDYPGIARFFKFGQLAVLVFFVVSGFVIYYSSVAHGQELRFRDYFIRRFRRIYPPFILALGITWLARCVIDGGVAEAQWRELAGNLAMLQDENVDSWFSPYLENSSLWSLSYEWAFYMLFFATHWLLKKHPERQLWVVAAAAFGGFAVHWFLPSQLTLFLMYYPIWWAGVELAREYIDAGEVTLRRQLLPLALVAAMAGLWVLPVVAAKQAGQALVMWQHPVIELRHFITAVFILVCAQAWNRARWRGFYTLLGPFERLAPISYGLYIVHKPIVHVAAARSPLGNPWLELLWVVPLVLALSWLVERWVHRYVIRVLHT